MPTMIPALAVKSLRLRKFTAGLTVLSIALAVTLLLGVERIRSESRDSFAATVSGTDLVVGARSSPVHLLLYAVFRIGNATNNMRWESYQAISRNPAVAWTIPVSLGDSHRGFRVVGTTSDYFAHYRFGNGRSLEMANGRQFEGARDAVLGADVARQLGYRIGDAIAIAHGAGDISFALHDDQPFRIVGVLARTGTPVDRSVHVALEGLDALHADAAGGFAQDPLSAAMLAQQNHAQESGHADTPAAVTAVLVGLKSRGSALSMQRFINEYPGEPLTAILPGVALLEVWEIVGTVERTLLAVSVLVVVVGLAGMLVALLTSLSERRREMAVLRSVGARPLHVFSLILGEAGLLTALGTLLGVVAVYGGLIAGRSWLESRLGLFIDIGWPSAHETTLLALVVIAGLLIGLVPAWRIYRYSLADGLTVRL
jgi:putative ABC transport system permease protein